MTRPRLLLPTALALTIAVAVCPALPAAADSPPTVNGVSPNQGPTMPAAGSTVTVMGSGFGPAGSQDVVTFGTITATSVTVTSDTQLTAGIPQHSAGMVDIQVCATGCNSQGGFSPIATADEFTFLGLPTVSYLTPRTGPTNGGTTVTLTGTGFTSNSTVSFDGTPATDVVFHDSTTLDATSPPHSAGSVHVQVTTPGGTSAQANNGTDTYTYVPPPTVTALSPASGPIAGGSQVAITGTGFINQGANSVSVSFGGTPGTNTFVVSPTTLYTNVPAHARGPVDVLVSAPGGTNSPSATDVYTYLDVPVVSSVSPSSGFYTGGTTVTVTGTGFTPDAQVSFDGTPAASVSVVSSTQLSAVTASRTLAGVEDDGYVIVTTADGPSPITTAARFTYTQPVPMPVVTGVSPSSGPTAGGTLVTVTGRNFLGLNVDPTYLTVIVQPVGHPNDGVTVFHKDLTKVSAGKFTIRMPRADVAGQVDILVVSPGIGCTCTIRTSARSSADHFTYGSTVSLTAKQSKVTVSHNKRATLSFTLKGARSGKVSVKNGSKTLTSGTLKSGNVTLTLPKLAKGSYSFTVTYVSGGKPKSTTVKLTVT